MKFRKLFIISAICLSFFTLMSCGSKDSNNSNVNSGNKISIVDNKYYYFDSLLTEEDAQEFYRIKFNTNNTSFVLDESSFKDFKTISNTAKNKYEKLEEIDQYLTIKLHMSDEYSVNIYITNDFKFILDYMFSLPKDNLTYLYKDANGIDYSVSFKTERKEFSMDITIDDEKRIKSGTYTFVRIFNDSLILTLNSTDGNYYVELLKNDIALLYLKSN